MQQLVDEPAAENRRPEPALDLVHVVARLQHADDRRVGARPADAVLFERLDQRPFVEARRRLRELLLRRDARAPRASALRVSTGSTPLAGSSSASACPASGCGAGRSVPLALLGFGRALAVDGQPAGELRHRALGAEQVVARGDVDRRVVEHRRHHLRRDEAVPDQAIEVELIGRQMRAHRLRVVLHRRRPNRFVRVLRRRLDLVAVRLLGHVGVAELRR